MPEDIANLGVVHADLSALVRTRFEYWTDKLKLSTELELGGPTLSELVQQRRADNVHFAHYDPETNRTYAYVGEMFFFFHDRDLLADTDRVTRFTDGVLLHELGHCRDRYWRIPHLMVKWSSCVLAVLVFAASLIIEETTTLQAGWAVVALFGVAVVAVVLYSSAQWFAERVRWRAMLEDRADDYAGAVGGIDVVDEFLWLMLELDYSATADDGVYRPGDERRERQWQRITGHGVPAARRGAWGR